jgi:hypothetical protein
LLGARFTKHKNSAVSVFDWLLKTKQNMKAELDESHSILVKPAFKINKFES